jgi:hypothetical protein
MKHSDINNKHINSGFAVPEGYFEKMKAEVLQKTYPKQNKIIALNSTLMKYAAVLMIGFLVAGGWFYLNNTENSADLYANMVESEIYMYEYAMLDEYTTNGSESDLTNSEDNYLINSEYGSEILMYEEN